MYKMQEARKQSCKCLFYNKTKKYEIQFPK